MICLSPQRRARSPATTTPAPRSRPVGARPAKGWTRGGLAAAALLLALPAQAQFLTGAQLLEHLDEADAGTSFMKRTMAMGYVSAVFDLARGERVCPESTVAASELLKVVHSFLRAHPERRAEPGAKLALDALAQRFTCAASPGH